MTSSALLDLVGPSHARAHRRSRLLSRMLVTAERPANESYAVFLPEGRIEYAIDGATTTWGEILPLGTHSHRERSWRWGFDDPTSPDESRRRLRAVYDAQAERFDAAAQEALHSGPRAFHDLCDYLSEASGFLAAFPAERETETVWFAVNPTLRPDWPASSPNNTWCDTCGVPAVNARKLFRGALGSVCDACMRLVLDVLKEREKPEDLDLEREVHPTLPPCILRGDFVERMMTTYTAISYSAALQVSALCRTSEGNDE
jgi:hypothetical protein